MGRPPKKRNQSRRIVRSNTNAPRVISFRLDEKESELLNTKATDQGLSSHQFAHDLVITAMQQDADGARSNFSFEELETRIRKLRDDLCLATEVLLVGAGKATKEQAAEWVDANLPSEAKIE